MRCVLALVVLCAAPAFPQMATASRTAQPRRPLPPGLKPPQVRFEDVAERAGLTGVNVSGAERNKSYIVETTGTGAAIFDYDNDGLPDIFLAGADRFDRAEPRPAHYLYRNLGGLKFEDVTKQAGIAHTGWAQGVCAGDIDNDGRTDLFITHWGHNVLLRNRGDGTFRDETEQRGLYDPAVRWSTGCAFLDYDRDGNLDLFVARYVVFDPNVTPKTGVNPDCNWKGFPVVCGPRGLKPEHMALYHNEGGGRFKDVSKEAGIADSKGYGFTALAGDFDNDGWVDIYVACDSTPSLLFHNKRDGTFEETGVYSGAAYNEDGQEQAGMGASAGDYDRDGWIDLVKTNFTDDTPNLYRNHRDGTFVEATTHAGLAVNTQYLGWGTAFVDFDNDGWPDVFIANGHVYPEVDQLPLHQKFKQSRLLYWNRRDGQFLDMSAEAGPGITDRHASRGIAVGDLDNDGVQEIVVVNMHERPSLLKNTAPHGGAVLVRALTASGRDAVGARLSATTADGTQTDEVRSGGYHISQGDFRVHFGLGEAAKFTLAVRWPDGKTDTWRDLAANQLVTVQQGKGIVQQKALR